MVYTVRSDARCMSNDYEERINKSELYDRQHYTVVNIMGTIAGLPHVTALGLNSLICIMGRTQHMPQRLEG